MELSVTLIIIIVTTLVSLSAFSNQDVVNKLIFYPPSVAKGQWYRFFSCGLIHADLGHLIFNMLALYLFGAPQEHRMGSFIYKTGVEARFADVFGENGKWIYLLMYILALGACLIPTYSKNKDNYHYRSLGASGGVSAVIFASILFDPLMGIGLFFIPIFVAGFIFGIIYLAISSWLDRRGGDHINHSAHIFGALFGVGFTVIACRIVDYPIIAGLIDTIKHADPRHFIQFGGGSGF